MAVSFIGGGNLSSRRKPQTCLQVTDKLCHIMLYRVHLSWAGFELTMLVVIGTDCIGSCKSKYHTIATKTAPTLKCKWDIWWLYTYCTNTWTSSFTAKSIPTIPWAGIVTNSTSIASKTWYIAHVAMPTRWTDTFSRYLVNKGDITAVYL